MMIGTRTSAWDHLAVRIDSPLFEPLVESCSEEGDGITDEQLKSLQSGLSSFWGLPVELFAHEATLSNGNALETLMFYVDCLNRVPEENQLLLDLSHGFRPMPVLLLSAIRFQQALEPQRQSQFVKIVYGEYGGEFSNVREMDAVWDGIHIAEAARKWFETFAAKDLASALDPFWSEGARALIDLGQAVQGNDLQRTISPLRALAGAIKKTPEHPPAWFGSILEKLKELHKELNHPLRADIFLALARRLDRHRLLGQAYLALDEALIEVVLGSDSREKLDWEEIRDLIKEKLKVLKDWHPWMEEDLWKIHSFRNFIAHGGRKESVHSGFGKTRLEDLSKKFKGLSDSLEKVMHDSGSPLKLKKPQ